MESSVSSTSPLVSDVHSDKIIVHLVEGFRTVIVDDQVQFRSVIKSITERLTKQYYERERQEGSSVSDDNIYGWIFGICWNCNGRKVWIHPETSHGDFLKKFNPYSETNQKGRLELLVRYYPDDFVDVHKRHRIIFTLMYKQVLYEYLKKESVPLELAIKLACLEIRRKYPQLNHKAAKLIANAIEDETFKTLFPEKVLLQVRLRDLRRQVVKQFQQMDEKASSDAVIEFLNLVKKHLFFFEREFYDVRLHESFPIATTLMVGPGACQISSGARISSGRENLTLLARFEHVLRIEPISEPNLHVLLLYVEASSEPLYINCSSEDELENLADLIDGYVRGSRTVPDGSVIVANGAARQLPDIPAPSFESLSNIPANYAAQATVTNQMRFVPKTIESDDDYATIVDPIEEKIDPSFELDRSKIDLLREIGQGQFGNVHCANYKNDGITALVAVKKTNFEEDSEELKQKFIEEAQIMCHFNHKHIVQLIGVCTKGWPILIVMEYCALGCIRDYLIQNAEALDIHHLLEYIYQLSSALKYLEEQNFVHRDIAARNLMLTNEHTVKLGDFGLSRQVKETDAYYVATTGKLPIKWMAPESINYRKFTSQSDVWMFAVCSWEILSCGVKPFQGVKNNDVILQIENGIRLECPKKCPLSLFKIMKQCWKYQAHLRPTAAQNHEQIGYLLDSFNQEDSANVYSVNSELRTKTEIMPDDLFTSLQRNPLLPPKALPKEVREHTARQKLEEKIKRDSTIMTKISDQSSEASENQKWAEEKMLQSQESLNRTGSLGSRSSHSRSESSSSNLASSANANAKIAPPKPPRTAKVSNSSSDVAAVHNPYAHETLKDESSLFPPPPKSSTNFDAEKVDSDSSSSTRSSKKSLALPAPAPIKPLLEEMPKLNLKDVVLDKTRALNRENDTIWAATLDVVKELVTLRNSAETARPESLINQIKSIGLKCKKLDGEVTSFCVQLEDAERREIELEKRSVYAEMKQVISQITNVRNFDGTKTASEYRNVLMASILVMSIAVKNLQDVIDKARQVLST